MCLMARGNESLSSSESDSDDEMPSYEEIVQQNHNYAKVCTSQQKKLRKIKEKCRQKMLGSPPRGIP